MVKNFVLDTNILLHSPHAMINGFEDNNIIITGTTLQELDTKKELGGEIGYNARESIRILDSLREKGDLVKGVALENGGTLFVEPDGVKQELLPDGYSISVPDNRILSACIYLNNRNSEPEKIILITNDVSMRVNASAIGLKVEGYRNDQVESTGYTGHTDKEVSDIVIDRLYKDGRCEIDEDAFLENEFVTLHAGRQSALTVFRYGQLNLIKEQKTFGGTRPLNAMQSYALWAMRAPAEEIPLVILIGAAGTAKTFLSLAVGLEFTYTSQRGGDGDYHKVLLSRPNGIGFSNIGFLPGDLDKKLSPLMASYYDNMEILLSGNGREKESREQIQMQMDDILETGVVEVCSLDFIRGRSLQDTYIICDEAQNASRGLIRDVITRAGRGSKVILAGDPGQIDVPLLDKRSNGLVYAASKMAGSPLAAIITFESGHSVRSALAKEAIERMNF